MRRPSARTRSGKRPAADEGLAIVPLTPRHWLRFEHLFGPRGACGGCWCMTPRLVRRDYEEGKGERNRLAMKRLVERGPPPGLIALRRGEAIAWVAVAPRAELPRLSVSRILAPVDERPVWSIPCLFVHKDARRAGLSARLIRAAAEFAFARGATIVEGYPQDPRQAAMPDVFAWTGITSAFEKAGFTEVARRSKTRPIVRIAAGPRGPSAAKARGGSAGPGRSRRRGGPLRSPGTTGP